MPVQREGPHTSSCTHRGHQFHLRVPQAAFQVQAAHTEAAILLAATNPPNKQSLLLHGSVSAPEWRSTHQLASFTAIAIMLMPLSRMLQLVNLSSPIASLPVWWCQLQLPTHARRAHLAGDVQGLDCTVIPLGFQLPCNLLYPAVKVCHLHAV